MSLSARPDLQGCALTLEPFQVALQDIDPLSHAGPVADSGPDAARNRLAGRSQIAFRLGDFGVDFRLGIKGGECHGPDGTA
jgi:hypothetical protein